MSLHLTKEELKYITNVLDKQSDYWVKDKILSKIKTYIKKRLERQDCDHKYGHYYGEKVCCMKCGGFAENMGESWTATNSPVNLKTIEKEYDLIRPLENLWR